MMSELWLENTNISYLQATLTESCWPNSADRPSLHFQLWSSHLNSGFISRLTPLEEIWASRQSTCSPVRHLTFVNHRAERRQESHVLRRGVMSSLMLGRVWRPADWWGRGLIQPELSNELPQSQSLCLAAGGSRRSHDHGVFESYDFVSLTTLHLPAVHLVCQQMSLFKSVFLLAADLQLLQPGASLSVQLGLCHHL